MVRVAFDAGHGIDTYPPAKGVPEMAEFEFNAAVVGYAKELAERQGFRVVLTQGLSDLDTPLRTRTRLAFDAGVEAIISFHADAARSQDARGHWVFYWHDHYSSRELAHIWDHYASSILPIPRRGPRPSEPGTWSNFHMTREPARRDIPAILIEHGFMTNPADLTHLMSDTYRRQCAEVAVRALCEFFAVPFEEGETMEQPEWKTEAIDYFAERRMLNDPEGWKQKVDEPLPAWAAFIMLRRIHEDIRSQVVQLAHDHDRRFT